MVTLTSRVASASGCVPSRGVMLTPLLMASTPAMRIAAKSGIAWAFAFCTGKSVMGVTWLFQVRPLWALTPSGPLQMPYHTSGNACAWAAIVFRVKCRQARSGSDRL